jgi:hypothetical protein
MKHIYRLFIALLILASLLTACAPKSTTTEKIEPFKLEVIEGSDFQRVILTEKAAKRLDIQTAPIRDGNVIPYAAVLYGLEGETWAYTNPEPLVFVRESIVIDQINGDSVTLSEGPEAGTAVVIIGVAELYGAEVGVKK